MAQPCRSMFCSRVPVLALLALCVLATSVDAHKHVRRVGPGYHSSVKVRGVSLVDTPDQTVLTYHNGTLLTAAPETSVYLIYYGTFSPAQRAIISDFFASFGSKAPSSKPSVRSWWSLTLGYKDTKGTSVTPSFAVAGQVSYSSQNNTALTDYDIEVLVANSLETFPANPNAIYVVLTADNVQEENFCMSACATHFVSDKTMTKGTVLPFIWVGNPGKQCPGQCAWPFAKPTYGPADFTALVPPNGDVGIDGLLINLGSMLAGIATDPYNTGYYQGEPADPLEAATACVGIYGVNSFPGYPGQLLKDQKTNASFNVYGANKREFLMPAIWNPYTSLCTPP